MHSAHRHKVYLSNQLFRPTFYLSLKMKFKGASELQTHLIELVNNIT